MSCQAQSQSTPSNAPTSVADRLRTKVIDLVLGPHALSLADQVVVSGTSLLSLVLVGRFTRPSQLGIYTIAMSVCGLLLAVQDALILLPYTIHRHKHSRTASEHAGMMLLHAAILGGAATAGLALAAAVAATMPSSAPGANVTWLIFALVFVVPSAMLREVGRGYSFAHLRVERALFMDLAIAALQIGVLVFLAGSGRMSALGACAALGIASALPSLIWLYATRRNFSIRRDQVREATRETWRLGKWLCAGQITVSVQGYVCYWMMPLLVGITETGIFAAASSVASLANPLLTAFRNILTPRAMRALNDGGHTRLLRQAILDAATLGAAMSVFCIVVLFAGDVLLRLVFRSAEYAGHGHLVTILAIAMMLTAVGSPASNALASMQRPRPLVVATSVGGAVTVLAVWVFSVRWGLMGSAYGFLVGSAAGACARWIALVGAVWRRRTEEEREAALHIVLKLTQAGIDSDCDITWLGNGRYGSVYRVASRAGEDLYAGYPELVVKLYAPGATDGPGPQFASQSRIHSAISGKSVGGWTVNAPSPLEAIASPSALIMTLAEGEPLGRLLVRRGGGEEFRLAAHALASAMAPYWAAGHVHGDLAFRNILVEPTRRVLWLIDTDASITVRGNWSPAVVDLAGLLYDLVTNLRPLDPRGRMMFTRNVLLAHAATIRSAPERHKLIEEIRAFAVAELELLDLELSPRGLYHLVQRWIALRRINELLATLHVDALLAASSP